MVPFLQIIRFALLKSRRAVLAAMVIGIALASANGLSAERFDSGKEASKTADSGDDANSMFSVVGYQFQQDFLIITYNIRYPGMTKVKLFDSSQTLLWRSQYVNDEEGDHQLVLRKSALTTGNQYLFEFDYKNQKKTLSISL